MSAFHRTPTFVVGNAEQRKLLEKFQRREQHFDEEYRRNKPLCFSARAYQKTHPQKAQSGRTDADVTLVSPMLLGVADGVSQIEDFGIDPSELPRELLAACNELGFEQLFPHAVGKPVRQDAAYLGPIPMMKKAFMSTDCLGSTTVLLTILDNSTRIHGKLHPMIAVMSIGDCELLVLRRTTGRQGPLEAVFHTEMQRIDGHAQAPLQVARVDDRVDPNFNESITVDVIERGSAVHCMSAYEGDIVVQGSDGVFDNLFLDELVDICNEYLPPSSPGTSFVPIQPTVLEQITRRIVQECHNKSKPGPDGQLPESPIGKGGKVDDTCCVVGEVIEWTKQHSEVWQRVRAKQKGKQHSSRGSSMGFCNLNEASSDAERRGAKGAASTIAMAMGAAMGATTPPAITAASTAPTTTGAWAQASSAAGRTRGSRPSDCMDGVVRLRMLLPTASLPRAALLHL
eukprot:CAMPEP_0117510124 /NCGR_PEP_ID=MMETSP0784-20121206/27829_1 /TAXON_ID=39447 /ORGANISM="" /LENGTH=455 /DNA_ID=CAMNT_0005305753 /DNA_START=48 /DNA_END=1413 /DNA_ORIENTATION=-